MHKGAKEEGNGLRSWFLALMFGFLFLAEGCHRPVEKEVQKDREEAPAELSTRYISHHLAEAEQGDAEAMFQHVEHLVFNLLIPISTSDAVEAFNQHRAQDHHTSWMEVSHFQKLLAEDSERFAEAMKWMERAAEAGLTDGQYFWGSLLAAGVGMDKDWENATYYLEKAARKGHDWAQYHLANELLRHHSPGDPGYEEGLKWLKRSADDGNGWAQYHLGNLLTTKSRVPEEMEEGVRLLRVAVDNHINWAMQSLAELILHGKVPGADLCEALELFYQSHQSGLVEGTFMVGYMIATGKGVPKNSLLGYRWVQEACARRSSVEYQSFLNDISKNLDASQLAEASSLALQLPDLRDLERSIKR